MFLSENLIDDDDLAYEPIYKNLFNDDYRNDKNETNSTYAINESREVNKLESLGYEFDENENLYIKEENGITITYSDDFEFLLVVIFDDKINKKFYYYINKHRIYFKLYYNGLDFINFKYYLDKNLLDCIEGDCNNYLNEIDYILDEYENILSVL